MHKTTILCQFGLFCHHLTTISPSILNHFWWELYQVHCILGQCHIPSTTIWVEFDTRHSSDHRYEGATDRLQQDQHGRDKWSCCNIHRHSDQGSSKFQDAISLPHELGDHGVHHQIGPVPRGLHNEWGTYWVMLIQENCPTYICGHHGNCLTYP